MRNLLQDLRYGVRVLAKNPGFTAGALLTLARGIGANTAIFTLVDAIMLKSLPVANPKQLYRLGDNDNCCVMVGTQNGGSFVLYSDELYEYLRDHTPEFSHLAAFTPFLADLSVRRGGAPGPAEPYEGELVSGSYFEMFGLGALAGRVFTSKDDAAGAPPVAVMSYHTWQEHFGLDPAVIGATFTINQVAYTVVGIAPPGFFGDTLRSDPPDFWVSLSTEPAVLRRGLPSLLHSPKLEWLYVIGRLKNDAGALQAQSHLTIELQQWLWSAGYAEATPEQRSDPALVDAARREIAQQHIRLTPAAGGVDKMQTDYAAGLRLLMTVAGLVLLTACANIANLFLARGAASRLYTAVRAALGASRQRLIRQVLTESVLLAVLGGLAGLYVAYAGTHTILWVAFRGAQYLPIDASPSWLVLGFAFLVSLVTGIVFGAAPAWAASRVAPAEVLRGAGHSTGDHASLARRSLVVVQVALSMVLLIGAGLLTRSLRNLEDQRLGFETRGRLIVHVNPTVVAYPPEKLYGLYQQLQQRLAQIPGVLSASLSGYSPLGGNNWHQRVYIEGHPPDFEGPAPSWDRVGPHYFETIGTRLLRGRAIEERDTPAAQHVAVINETFARKFFRNEDPLGQHLGLGDARHSGDYEVVGVVEDAKYQDTRGPAYATVFLPLLQTPAGAPSHASSVYIHDIELRGAGRPASLEPAVRRALAYIDPNLTVLGVVSFSEQVARNFNRERLVARLTELFGLLALTLACVGLYGVASYSVARRISE